MTVAARGIMCTSREAAWRVTDRAGNAILRCRPKGPHRAPSVGLSEGDAEQPGSDQPASEVPPEDESSQAIGVIAFLRNLVIALIQALVIIALLDGRPLGGLCRRDWVFGPQWGEFLDGFASVREHRTRGSTHSRPRRGRLVPQEFRPAAPALVPGVESPL
jgi:hypothetical protein